MVPHSLEVSPERDDLVQKRHPMPTTANNASFNARISCCKYWLMSLHRGQNLEIHRCQGDNNRTIGPVQGFRSMVDLSCLQILRTGSSGSRPVQPLNRPIMGHGELFNSSQDRTRANQKWLVLRAVWPEGAATHNRFFRTGTRLSRCPGTPPLSGRIPAGSCAGPFPGLRLPAGQCGLHCLPGDAHGGPADARRLPARRNRFPDGWKRHQGLEASPLEGME